MEAHKRQQEMRGAARAAEMTEEDVALEKPKGLAEKEAARKAATGQAGTAKRAAEEATRRAASGQAGTVKHAAGEATRWAKKMGCSGYGARRSGHEAAPIEAGATRALCTSHPQDPRDARRGLVRRGGSQAQRLLLPRGERACFFVRARILALAPPPA